MAKWNLSSSFTLIGMRRLLQFERWCHCPPARNTRGAAAQSWHAGKIQELTYDHNTQQVTGAAPLLLPIDHLLDNVPGNIPPGVFTISEQRIQYFGSWVFQSLNWGGWCRFNAYHDTRTQINSDQLAMRDDPSVPQQMLSSFQTLPTLSFFPNMVLHGSNIDKDSRWRSMHDSNIV